MFKHDFEFVDGHQSHLGHIAAAISPVDKDNKSDNSSKTIQTRKVLLGQNLEEQNLQKFHFL